MELTPIVPAGTKFSSLSVDLATSTEELFSALQKDRVTEAEITELLRKGAEVAIRDKYGWTPLMHAAWNGHTVAAELIIEKLLQEGKPEIIKAKNNENGMDALMFAAWHGKADVVNLLLDYNAHKNTYKDGDMTPLMLASWSGRSDVVKLLLDSNDFKLDAKYKDGRTALMFAAWGGHTEVMGLLLKKIPEADIRKAYVNKGSNANKTAVMFAQDNNMKQAVDSLVSEGAYTSRENVIKDNDITPLMLAAWKGNVEEVRKQLTLLKNKDEVDAQYKKDGRTALMWAAFAGHVEVIKVLIDEGKAVVDAKDKDGRTALMWAARNGKEEAAMLLKEKLNNIKEKNDDGLTAEMYASAFGFDNLARKFAA